MTASPPITANLAPIMLGHDIYRGSSYGADHPLRIPRVSTVMDLARAMGWLPQERFRISPRAKARALEVFHTPDYLKALEAAEVAGAVSDAVRQRHKIGTTANPVFAEVWRRPATSAGGSLLAGELLAKGGVIYHPAGGTHHAFADYAGGFCYLNDPVLAMLSLRRNGARRLAYVDIDAHHGDGVEAAFADDPDTLIVDIHEEKRWPFTGALGDAGVGQVFNLPVPKGMNDTEMEAVTESLILPRVAAFKPDAVVLQCGADAVEEDPLSRLSLSNNAHWAIVAALRDLSPRYLVLGGGGYNPWSVGRLWTGVWATLIGADIPDTLPEAGAAVLGDLVWHRPGRNRAVAAHLKTTLRDASRPGPVRAEITERLAMLARRPSP